MAMVLRWLRPRCFCRLDVGFRIRFVSRIRILSIYIFVQGQRCPRRAHLCRRAVRGFPHTWLCSVLLGVGLVLARVPLRRAHHSSSRAPHFTL